MEFDFKDIIFYMFIWLWLWIFFYKLNGFQILSKLSRTHKRSNPKSLNYFFTSEKFFKLLFNVMFIFTVIFILLFTFV